MVAACCNVGLGGFFINAVDSTESFQFKFKLTLTMIIDFAGCWLIEVLCKRWFADLEPKGMITRGRERREKRRAQEEARRALENGTVEEKKTQ